MRLPSLAALAVATPLVLAVTLVAANAHALEPVRPGALPSLSLPGTAYPPSAFATYRPLSLLGSSPADRDVVATTRRRAPYVHSLGWVGTVMGFSGMAIGATFLGLSSEGSSSASLATRTMAHTDRTVAYSSLLGGAVMLGVGVVTLVMTGTDVRTALGETLARIPGSGKPALRVSF
jgi:hypothetical protein